MKKYNMRYVAVLTAVLAIHCGAFGEGTSSDGYAFGTDGSVIHFDEFNTRVGTVGVEAGIAPETGKQHVLFSYRGAGVYAPAILLGEDSGGNAHKEYNLLHLKFKVQPDGETLHRTMLLRLQQEGSSEVSFPINIFEYLAEEKDENGYYDCMIPLDYFLCPVERVTHAYLFCNSYETRETNVAIDFDLAMIAFRNVEDLGPYRVDFRLPDPGKNMKTRLSAVRKASFKGSENDTRAGDGFSGEELFELQQELRLLVQKNLGRAPVKRELEILKLLRYGNPDREIRWQNTRRRLRDKGSKEGNRSPSLFYDGYAVYNDVLRYRATGDPRYLECAMVTADYVMNHFRADRNPDEYIDELVANNGTLGLGRGFSGVCEVIVELMKMPHLKNQLAPSMNNASDTWKEKAQAWMPMVMRAIDQHQAKGEYHSGKWLEGDGMSINRFLYYTHLLAAATEAADALDASRYGGWTTKVRRLTGDILTFFQGDCLLTGKTLVAHKRVCMTWNDEQGAFVSPYGPYVIWAYAHDRDNTEDFAHIQMDVEAIDSILEIDPALLKEDFKKKMSTMLLVATFNMETGGMPRDIGPGVPGRDPALFPPWHAHYVPEYGRYVGKYCAEAAYDAFMDYQLRVWDTQLIAGQLGRFSQYPMPREIVEARLFRHNAKALFPRGF